MCASKIYRHTKIQSKLGVYVQNSIVFYDALPGLETVRSSIVINSTQDYFKKGKMKISCTATMFNLYNETKEVEIMEDTPQLAPIREHSTHSGDAGFSSNCSCLDGNVMGVILISILLSHLWMRRLLNTL
ncbi:hypothetical protein WA026_002915 [Henosepilachna vigintioctopunctata]|uniref:Uncharacterized protein n=1 Tax=Henosepilachna vigintioctopunctata TaxID=420089 RepID=A0AAW1TLY7_9CUCU